MLYIVFSILYALASAAPLCVNLTGRSSPHFICLNYLNAGVAAQKELALYSQCGGEGGNCGSYGACADTAYPGYQCIAGASCKRQSNWYYQCLSTNLDSQLVSWPNDCKKKVR
jgi:hypothetical protein